MSDVNEPLENNSHDELDDQETIQAQDAGEMSLLGEGATMVGDASIPEELEAVFELDPSQYVGTSRYEIIDPDKPIGKGGFGTVWKVRDRKLGSVLVMKRLHSAEEAGQQGIARFINEARTIASLNHQNIITVNDIGRDDKGYYIIAEYVDGGSLRNRIDEKGGLSQKEAIDIIEQVGRALAYAHRRGVIHRDIKPANILLTRDGIPKVADFGLAKIGRDSDLSVSGMAMGSLAFMPPEQRKDAKSADHRADIYSLGKTLYHTLTGKIPETIRESEIPATVRKALLKAIEPFPEDRYFTIDEFIKDLKEGRGTEVTQKTIQEGICPECGRMNQSDADYCEGCGSGLVENCPVCAREKRVGLTFCAGCGTEIPKYQEIEERLNKLQAYLKEKKYIKADKECQKLLSMSPHEKQKEQIRKHHEEASNRLKEIKELKSEAEKLYNQERFEKTKSAFEEILKLVSEEELDEIKSKLDELPHLIKKRNLRNILKEADELFNASNYMEAITVYKKASDLGAQDIKTRIEEAKKKAIESQLKQIKSFMDRYDFKGALDRWKILNSLDPQYEEAKKKINEIEEKIQHLHISCEQMKKSFNEMDYFQTEKFCKEVLSINPNQSEAKNILVRTKDIRAQVTQHLEGMRIAVKEGKYVEAEKICVEILSLDPGNSEANRIQKEARDYLSKLYDIIHEAKAYYLRSKYKQARKEIKKAIHIGPNEQPAIELKQKIDEAIRKKNSNRIVGAVIISFVLASVLLTIVQFNRRSILQAKTFVEKGEYNKAIHELDQTVMALWVSKEKKELSMELIQLLSSKADERFALQKYTEPHGDNAFEFLNMVLNIDPDNRFAKQVIRQIRDAYMALGDKSSKKGDYSKAGPYYKKALYVSPGFSLAQSKLEECEKHLKVLEAKRKARIEKEKMKEEKAGKRAEQSRQKETNLRAEKSGVEANISEFDKVGRTDTSLQVLKDKIVNYYNAKGEWKGIFRIDYIEKMRIEDISSGQKNVHVRYKYKPIPGNKRGRRGSGFDQRIFILKRIGDTYKITRMLGNMSARF